MSKTNRTEFARLSPEGEKEFESYIQRAKDGMRKVCDEMLGEIYMGLPGWIESDSWGNFRNTAFSALSDYTKLNKYDAKRIRELILENHREQIISDLNQDNIERIAALEKLLSETRDMYSRYR